MKDKQFKHLLKVYKNNLQYLIYLHTIGNIFLNSKQLDQVIKQRGERKYPYYEIVKGRQVIVYE